MIARNSVALSALVLCGVLAIGCSKWRPMPLEVLDKEEVGRFLEKKRVRFQTEETTYDVYVLDVSYPIVRGEHWKKKGWPVVEIDLREVIAVKVFDANMSQSTCSDLNETMASLTRETGES